MRGAHGSLPEVDGAKPRPMPEAMQLLREAVSHAHIVELLGPPLGERRQQRREAGPWRYGLLQQPRQHLRGGGGMLPPLLLQLCGNLIQCSRLVTVGLAL